MTTHYQTLGIPEGASSEHVRDSWLLLIQAFHPDRFPQGSKSQREAEERLKAINAAYEVLKNPVKRAAYDAELARRYAGFAAPQTSSSAPSSVSETKSAKRAYSPYNEEWKGKGPYCYKCDTPFNASGYCPTCEKFSSPAVDDATASRRSKFTDAVTTGSVYLLLLAAGFALLRFTAIAFVCATLITALLCWRRCPSKYKNRFAMALSISLAFLALDVFLPTGGKKTATQQTGAERNPLQETQAKTPTELRASPVDDRDPYSAFPCDSTQQISPIDHKPCKPKRTDDRQTTAAPGWTVVGEEPVSLVLKTREGTTDPGGIAENLARSATRNAGEPESSQFGFIPDQPSRMNRRQAVAPRPQEYKSLPTGTSIGPEFCSGGHGALNVKNGTNVDAVVRLYDTRTFQTICWFFVRSHESARRTAVPQGMYALAYTTGLNWVETKDVFTWQPSYSRFDRVLRYEEERVSDDIRYRDVSVTLHPVVGGNVRAQEISREDFLKGHQHMALQR